MTARYPATSQAIKLRRCGLPVPDHIRKQAAAEQRTHRIRRAQGTGRPTGRPRTSTSPRAEYHRERYRRLKAMKEATHA